MSEPNVASKPTSLHESAAPDPDRSGPPGDAARARLRVWWRWLGRAPGWMWALAIYLLSTLVYFLFAAPEVLVSHTKYNHFALLADAWLDGRLELAGAPPSYAQMNDFAK